MATNENKIITFSSIRNLIPVSLEEFNHYMLEIYKILVVKTDNVDCLPSSKKQVKDKGISNYIFDLYLNLSPFIADKIFSSFDKDKDGFLSQKEFVNSMTKLYVGSFEETLEAVFAIYDFKHCGSANKNDIKLLMTYLPFKEECNNDYKTQLKGISEIDLLVQKTLGDKTAINYHEFKKIIKEHSEMYLHLLLFLYSRIPFNEAGMKASKYRRKKNTKPIIKKGSSFSPLLSVPSPDFTSTPFEPSEAYKKILEDYSNNNIFGSNHSLVDKDKDNEESESIANAIVQEGENDEFTRNDIIISNKQVLPTEGLNDSKSLKKQVFMSPKLKQRPKLSPNRSGIITPSKKPIRKMNSLGNLKQKSELDITRNPDDFEEYIYRYEESNKGKAFNKYFICLYKRDICIFTSEASCDCIEVINLTGCFIDQSPTGTAQIIVNKVKYFPLTIHFSSLIKHVYYFESVSTRQHWEDTILKELHILAFERYYTLKEELGTGKFGIVKKGIELETNKEVAVKIISKNELGINSLDMIYRELNYMKRMKHPSIVKLLNNFEDIKNIYIVMEYFGGGDLSDFSVTREKELTEHDAAVVIYNLGQVVKYINAYGIIHRDLKLDNILLVKKNDLSSIKVIDFGIALTLSNDEPCKEVACTVVYCAPEVLLEEGYNKEVDVWSVGVILYVLITNMFPFDDETLDNLIIGKKIVYTQHDFPKEIFGKKSKSLIDILDKCLEKNPAKRIKIDELLKHEWLEKNK